MLNLRDRVALVTGGARGLGLAVAQSLARAGASVVIGDVEGDLARMAAKTMESEHGVTVRAVRLDVSDENSVEDAYSEIERSFGRLDVLVNNAAVLGLVDGERVPLGELPLATWEQTLRVNLTGTFLMSRGALPLMRRSSAGRIVNISSRAARTQTAVVNAHYAASKAGLEGLSRVLALEVGKSGITVNSVAPGLMATDINVGQPGDYFERGAEGAALGRIATTEDVANAVLFLCSDEARSMTGVVLDVNAGQYMP